ncbi:hypothetical protein UCRPA7_4048 [Phaeoacremonium minimum UCRPA7]|uniref:Uncharacterized protein n=1 Tax=Phaeoacremonium minimum (strain UCR-PA7) TaxID=1286976 RepID=R8BMG4_PHAM7|nr:hypothetical protein UCRPA7_4048 [Phaeoacremonium minimum UCRPA7]EOO00455.1 hypothetical protein UCRPA7_4048 [Phaeoacremonium minimum UCRPA7]
MEPSELSASQKARLQRVADLMLDIYKTLAEMRYLDEDGIQIGPHDIEQLLPAYKEHGLDGSIVYLYSILPYVDTDLAGNYDFLQGGSFADFRNPEDVEQGRDPFYGSPEGDDFDDENGPYIRPWVTPLSLLGNHQSVIIYDAKQHRVWIIDQEGWESTDLALSDARSGIPLSRNRNAFEHIPSRPAEDVLRDINAWYHTLQVLPGGEHSGGEWNDWDMDLKGLYRRNGWPDDFDGDAFQIGQAREYCASSAKYSAEEPLRQVEKFRSWAKYADRNIEQNLRAFAEANTKDEEWTAKFNLWKSERSKTRNEKDLAKAEETAKRLCPGGVCQKVDDLPLWEAEILRHENRWKQESVGNNEDWAEKVRDDPDRENHFRKEQQRAQKEAAVYQQAYEASKADADRLCPGRTFESATGIKSLGRQDTLTSIQNQDEVIARLQIELEQIREWAEQIPKDATKTKEQVGYEVDELERSIDRAQQSKKMHEDWLAEHGNTD